MTDERHANRGLPTTELHGPEHDLQKRQRVLKIARNALIGFGVLLVLGLARVVIVHFINDSDLEDRAKQNNVMNVLVVQASDKSADAQLTLPSTVESYNESLLYARTQGYVKEWFKDIGMPVKKGDVLVELETPEVNKQVEEAKSAFNLAHVAFERWTKLRKEDAVSQQELDEKTAAYHQSRATLQRTKELLKFGKITAPFDGYVTRRNVNVGDLVNSGNGGTPQALFGVSQTKHLHLYVYVPQARSEAVKVGQEVKVYRPEAPDKIVVGKIARTAGAIDVATRTLQVDLEIPDEQQFLVPGAYVEAALPLDNQGRLVLPTNTLLFGSAGPQVAVVQSGQVLRKSVALGVDYGRSIEIIGGLDPADQVIVNPIDSITNGQKVTIAAASKPADASEASTSKPAKSESK
jgi:RND family efflux transporter MFP subunit